MGLENKAVDGVAYATISNADLAESSEYNYNLRARQNGFWTWAFWLLLLFGAAGGVYFVVSMDRNYGLKSSAEYLSNPAHCLLPENTMFMNRKTLTAIDETLAYTISDFVKHSWGWLVTTLVVGLFLGIGYVQAFKKVAHGMMIFAAVMHVVVTLVSGIFLVWSLRYVSGGILIALALFIAYFHWSSRDRLRLCARLFTAASTGLQENPGIIFLAVVLWVAIAGGFVATLGLTYASYANGSVGVNKYWLEEGHNLLVKTSKDGTNYCVNVLQSFEGRFDERKDCCQWNVKTTAMAYIVYSWLMFGWVTWTIAEVRLFAIAGTISQWYYLPPNASTRGTLTRSLGHALGPQFGTVVLGGLVLWMIALLRMVARTVTRYRKNALVALICMVIRICLELVLNMLQYLTRFATIWAAVKGDGFFEAGKKATGMLVNNALESIRVWWFPEFVVAITALSAAAVWGVGSGLMAAYGVIPGVQGSGIAIGVMNGIGLLLVLRLCGSILLNIVETVYFCYALDKESNQVKRDVFHEVFNEMPVHKEGTVVEQPGGDLSYGAAEPMLAPNQSDANRTIV